MSVVLRYNKPVRKGALVDTVRVLIGSPGMDSRNSEMLGGVAINYYSHTLQGNIPDNTLLVCDFAYTPRPP